MTTAVKSVALDYLEINAKAIVANIVIIMIHVTTSVVCAQKVAWTDILEHVVITLVGWGITAETAPWFVFQTARRVDTPTVFVPALLVGEGLIVMRNAKGRLGRIVNIHATDIVSTRHAIDLTDVVCMAVKMGNNVTGILMQTT